MSLCFRTKTPVAAHVGESAVPCTGIHRSRPLAGDSGPGLPPTPAVQQAQALQPCAPPENAGRSAAPLLWPPALPVPRLKLGLWSLPLAWMPQLLAAEGKRSCPGRRRASAALSRLGCEAASAIGSQRGGERGARDPQEVSRLPPSPKTPRRKGQPGAGVSLLHLSAHHAM